MRWARARRTSAAQEVMMRLSPEDVEPVALAVGQRTLGNG